MLQLCTAILLYWAGRLLLLLYNLYPFVSHCLGNQNMAHGISTTWVSYIPLSGVYGPTHVGSCGMSKSTRLWALHFR